MADIDNLIAQGPGRRDFAPLGTLFGAWRDGVKARREDEAADARRNLTFTIGPDGRPDYGSAALDLLRGGDTHNAAVLAHMAAAAAAHDLARARFEAGGRRPDPTGDAMARAAQAFAPAASPAVAPSSGSDPDADASAQPDDGGQLPRPTTRAEANAAIAAARDAVAAGAPRDEIVRRLRQIGIDAGP
jgi:hypothetical protein